MDETIVRCPFCVLDNDFRPMPSIAGGCYACTSCGHLTAPGDSEFQCLCERCTSLRARVTAASQPPFWSPREKINQPNSSHRLLSAESDAGFARRSTPAGGRDQDLPARSRS